MTDWNPTQYRKFDAQRAAPFWELVGLIRPGVARMVDLGCGDGELTVEAARRLGVTSVVGVDSSPAMIARTGASAASASPVDATFVLGDIASWTVDRGDTGGCDLVLANASLQWVPNHEAVLTQWTSGLAPGGQLAVQVPTNGDHASHLVATEVGATEPFVSAMGGTVPTDPSMTNVLSPEHYAELLFDLGYEEQHTSLRVYPHVLESSEQVVEWVRGTNLNRFFERLPADLHEPFVDAYRTALLDRIGKRAPYLYTFKRILMWARLGRRMNGVKTVLDQQGLATDNNVWSVVCSLAPPLRLVGVASSSEKWPSSCSAHCSSERCGCSVRRSPMRSDSSGRCRSGSSACSSRSA